MDATRNRALYLAWMRNHFPDLLNPNAGDANLSGLFDTIGNTFKSVVDNVTSSLPQLATTYAQYRQSEQIIDLNTQRAKQGLAPLQNVNGQLVPYTGTYSTDDYRIAETGYSTSTILLAAGAVGFLIWLAMRK